MSLSAPSITRYFRRLRDPRRQHLKRHLLIDVIVIAICGVICGANDWQQVATFARHRRAWLETFLELPNGIPSHDTLERVFDRLDPQAFQACFRQWVEALADTLGVKHIAIDGKTLRHSGNALKGWKPLHMVSAWATACQLSLGQVAVDEKSNEITAIPRLLELLDLQGAMVTIDAMGCQKEIAARSSLAAATTCWQSRKTNRTCWRTSKHLSAKRWTTTSRAATGIRTRPRIAPTAGKREGPTI